MRASSLTFVLFMCVSLGACHKAKSRAPESEGPADSPKKEASVERVRAVGQLGPGRGTLVVSLEPGHDGQLTSGAPLSVEARGEHLHFPSRSSAKLDPSKLPLRIPIDVEDGALGPVYLDLSYYWCGATGQPSVAIARAEAQNQDSSCRLERANMIVDLDTTGDAPGGEAHVVHRPN